MNDVLDFYAKEAQRSPARIQWLASLQKEARAEFADRAFPSLHDEDWKYTNLAAFLAEPFAGSNASGPSLEMPKSNKPPIGADISIYNGQVLFADGFKASLPATVIVEPLLEALHKHEDRVKSWLGKILSNKHSFHALNMALLQTGLFIYVPRGIKLQMPLAVTHWQDKSQKAVHVRHLVILEEGASLSMIENYSGQDSTPYFSNVVTEVYLAERAEMIHYKIQQESKAAFHIGHLAVVQQASSRFASHSLSLGGKLARLDLSLKFLERDASCLLNGIYLPTDGQHIDHHTCIQHLVPECTSAQDYKGILLGKSRAVFNGKVFVAVGAIHSEASQVNKNLLLSAQAEIDTKPQLDIFADDVICTHGATVGQLDEEALFYMATRGIAYDEARALLIQAFAANNLDTVPDKEMRQWMTELINQQLGEKP